jgi:8-amino-7-oxononanoate synthase
VLLTGTLIRDYLLNYARPLIYTTSLSNAAIVAASCSFDLLEDGTAEKVRAWFLPHFRYQASHSTDESRAPRILVATKLAAQVLGHSTYFQEHLRASLVASSIPRHILSLPAHPRQDPSTMAQPPTPIVPLLTPRARALSAHLLAHGLNARPITWPTVPKGADRVRVCLHAGNTREELDALVGAAVVWAAGIAREERVGLERERDRIQREMGGVNPSGGEFLESKL